jgi:hypothetical protein
VGRESAACYRDIHTRQRAVETLVEPAGGPELPFTALANGQQVKLAARLRPRATGAADDVLDHHPAAVVSHDEERAVAGVAHHHQGMRCAGVDDAGLDRDPVAEQRDASQRLRAVIDNAKGDRIAGCSGTSGLAAAGAEKCRKQEQTADDCCSRPLPRIADRRIGDGAARRDRRDAQIRIFREARDRHPAGRARASNDEVKRVHYALCSFSSSQYDRQGRR